MKNHPDDYTFRHDHILATSSSFDSKYNLNEMFLGNRAYVSFGLDRTTRFMARSYNMGTRDEDVMPSAKHRFTLLRRIMVRQCNPRLKDIYAASQPLGHIDGKLGSSNLFR